MQSKRIVSLFLCVCIFIACLPVGGVWATSGTGKTLTDLLGNDYVARTTGFGSYEVTNSKYLTPSDNVAALGDVGDVVELSFYADITVEGANDQKVTFQIFDSDTNRVYMQIHEAGAWIGNSETFSTENAAKLRNANVTLLFVNNESNYGVYLKEANGTYSNIMTTTDKRTGSDSKNCNLFADGGATLTVSSIVCYDSDPEIAVTSSMLRRVDKINITGRTNGFYGANISPKPLGSVGDSVEISLKANITVSGDNDQNVSIQAPDADNTRAYMQIHENGAWISGSNNATMTFTADATTGLRNQKIVLRLLNKENGYELSYKTPEATQFTILGTSSGKRDGGNASNISISPGGGATVDIESIKYYGAIPTPVGNIADNATKPEKCIESFTSGILTLSAGQKTTIDGGAIPMGGYADVKVKAAKALKLQNSDGAVGSDIHFVISTTENDAYYAQNLSASKLKTYFISGAEDKAEVWHIYRIVRDAENIACYSVYHKTESDTTWTKVLADVDTTGAESGMQGMVFEAIDGAAQVEYVKVYTQSKLLDDPAVIAAENNTLWVDKDFSTADGFTLTNVQIANGILNVNKLAEGTSGSALISLVDCDLDGEWYLKMKHRLEQGTSATSLVVNGKRLRWTFAETYSFIQADTGNFTVSHPRELNAWYEYLVYFDGQGSANIYYRKSGENAWGVIATDVAMVDNSGVDEVKFEAGSGGSYKVDDLQIYTGLLIDLADPVVSGGTMSVVAQASVGHLYSEYDRRATVIGATYNREYGYTSFVDTKDYVMFLGKDTDLTTNFSVAGVDMTKNVATAMVWDSTDTVIPLVGFSGSGTTNTAEGRPEEGATTGLTAIASYNEVRITGLVGGEESVAAVLTDQYDDVKAVAQTYANQFGLVDMIIAVAPACVSGDYTLKIQYGNNVASSQMVKLYCQDILTTLPITDAISFKNFLMNYGSVEEKALMGQENFAEEAYARYLAAKGEATITDLYQLREVINSAIGDQVTERKLLTEINQAVANQKWSAIERLVLTTYRDYLTETATVMNTSLASIQGIASTKNLFMRMLGVTYSSSADVINKFNAAVIAQKNAEMQSGNQNTGFSPVGGGGSFGGGGGVVVSDEAKGETVAPVEKLKKFTDLDSVDWAKANILSLQERGILSGDGNGLFYPERNITREEFLKLVMEALGISKTYGGQADFLDVEKGAWYEKYVLAAFENGIVQGTSNSHFGIGENITRADMAVMLKRAMNHCGIATDGITPAFVYDDFADIPEYARESVFVLSEAGLMRGVGGNCFMPLSRATRAEAAVSIYRLCEYLNERR